MNNEEYQNIATLMEQINNSSSTVTYQDWINRNFSSDVTSLASSLTHNDLKMLTELSNSDLTIGQLSENLQMSQGGVSRRINLMVKKELITKTHRNGNHKTTYLLLTEMGQALVDFHQQLHEHMKEQFMQKMDGFSSEEIGTILSFLNILANN